MDSTVEEEIAENVEGTMQIEVAFDKCKAEIRTAVLDILSKETDENAAPEEPPYVPEETKLINDLIREYLQWNGYRFADEVLAVEMGQEGNIVVREALATRLGVIDDHNTTKIPLLYYIVMGFMSQDVDEEKKEEPEDDSSHEANDDTTRFYDTD